MSEQLCIWQARVRNHIMSMTDEKIIDFLKDNETGHDPINVLARRYAKTGKLAARSWEIVQRAYWRQGK